MGFSGLQSNSMANLHLHASLFPPLTLNQSSGAISSTSLVSRSRAPKVLKVSQLWAVWSVLLTCRMAMQLTSAPLLLTILSCSIPFLHSPCLSLVSSPNSSIGSSCSPTLCRSHPVPLALREKVKEAVEELDQQGVWEPVEKSEWALQLVTPVKPTGELRVTTDFTPLNKCIIPSRWPLPLPSQVKFISANAR